MESLERHCHRIRPDLGDVGLDPWHSDIRMANQVTEDLDPIEDDWAILRRNPEDEKFPSTLSMAEAIERVCKAIVDFAILTSPDERRMKDAIERDNKFPVFTVIPFRSMQGKHLWKVSLSYELISYTLTTEAHECCEKAVEDLFQNVSKSILAKAKQSDSEADSSEKEAIEARDEARKLKRLSSAMGSYSLVQPNLPLETV